MNKRLFFLITIFVVIVASVFFSITASATQLTSPIVAKNMMMELTEQNIFERHFTNMVQHEQSISILHKSITNDKSTSNNVKNELSYPQNNYEQLTRELTYLKQKYTGPQTTYDNLLNEKASVKITSQQQKPSLEDQSSAGMTKEEIEAIALTNPLFKGLINGQIRFYVEPVPSYAAPKVADDIEKFVDFMDGAGTQELKFKRVYNETDADLHISWIKNWGEDGTIGLTILGSAVLVGLGEDNCYGEWQPFDSPTVFKILFHELGHSLGFRHSNDPSNIMYPAIDTRFNADYQKSITLTNDYDLHIPFCNGGKYHYEVSTDDMYNRIDIYVVPPNTNYDSIIDSKKPYYFNCSKQDVTSYDNTCTIVEGSELWIHKHKESPNSAAGQVDVKIVDMNERETPDMSWNMQDSKYENVLLDEVWNMYQSDRDGHEIELK